MLKKVFALSALVCSMLAVAGEVSVTAVTAQQRYPWNGLVDIAVTMQGLAEDLPDYRIVFAATNRLTKTDVPIEHLMQNGLDANSGTTWTRKYIWDATKDVGEVETMNVMLTVDAKRIGGVQLWDGGPYWAECNVGAEEPEGHGYYFWWGDVVGYKRNDANNGWVSVKDGSSFSFDSSRCLTSDKNSSQLQSEGYIDANGNLVAAHDAASVHFGAPWRMPTYAEFAALESNCTSTWTIRNGVYGRLVTGKGAYASKHIFLPITGYVFEEDFYESDSLGNYWSSTPDSGYSAYALILSFKSGYLSSKGFHYRFYGQPVRPVR